MKNSTTFSALFVLLFSFTCHSQLKVDAAGRVGIGTIYPNPGYQCHLQGDFLISNHPSTPFFELQFKVKNGLTDPWIGSTTDIIKFYSQYTGFNKVQAEQFITVSDSTLKTNIVPIQNALEKIMALKSYSYDFKKNDRDSSAISQKSYGFLSQEIKEALPEVNITVESENLLLMDYLQIIPLLTQAIQEQQSIINSLEKRLKLTEGVIKPSASSLLAIDNHENRSSHLLFQNTPNPFTEKTVIKFKINKNEFENGKILIFKMDGELISEYTLSPEILEIEISGNKLAPGMYIYSLMINDVEVDSKRMILNK